MYSYITVLGQFFAGGFMEMLSDEREPIKVTEIRHDDYCRNLEEVDRKIDV